MFRLILIGIGVIFIVIASAICYPIYAIMKRRNRHKADLFALHFVQFGFKLACLLAGVKCIYKGLEYLPEDGDPVVFMSNHRGIFDAILTYKVVKGRTGNLAKQELGKIPLIGWWIKAIYGVLLDRSNYQQGMKCIVECVNNLKSGISMLAYPEGHRGKVEGELLMFHKGTFKMATKSGARIIPVAINGTGDIMEDHMPWIKSRTAVVEFCKPIDTKNLTEEEKEVLHNTVRDIIYERIQANASLIQ